MGIEGANSKKSRIRVGSDLCGFSRGTPAQERRSGTRLTYGIPLFASMSTLPEANGFSRWTDDNSLGSAPKRNRDDHIRFLRYILRSGHYCGAHRVQFLSLFSPDMERSIHLAASAHHTLGDGKTDSTKPINPIFAFVLFLDIVS